MRLKNKRGFTTVEVLTVASILAMLAGVICSTWIAVVRTYDGVTTETYTSTDAVTAMQKIVSDVREAKSVQLMDSSTRLRVQFPVMDAQGCYDRHTADPNNTVDYYLANSTGAIGTTGTYLWRNRSNDAEKRVIARDVKSILFEADTARSVKITVTASNPSVAGDKQTELTQRVVYLRNY